MTTTLASRTERQILRWIAWGAIGIGLILLVALGARIFELLASPTTRFSDLGIVLQGAPATETAPLPEHVVEVSSVRESVTVADLPQRIRWILVAQTLLQATLGLGMCIAAILLSRRLLSGSPFARSVIWTLFIVAVAVMLNGVVAPFLQAIAEAETLKFITDGVLSPTLDTGFGSSGSMLFGMKIDLAPFGIAIGLGALIAAFEAGARLQRETEGLI